MSDSNYGPEYGTRRVDSSDIGYTDDAGAIRADIGETRRRMSQALDEIGDRINPQHIKEQVKHNVREATIGKAETMARHTADRARDVRHSIMDTIRDNPLPAAVTGIGLGWLMWNGRRHEQERDRNLYASGYDYGWDDDRYDRESRLRRRSETGAHDDRFGMENDGSSRMEGVKERAGEMADRTREMMNEARERTADVADQVRDRAQDLADETRFAAHRVAERARYRSHRLEDSIDQTMHDNPLAIGAAAAALGLVVGLAAPSTRKEMEMMGGMRDRLRDRAKEATRDTAERVTHVAEETIQQAKTVAKETAREEGLTH